MDPPREVQTSVSIHLDLYRRSLPVGLWVLFPAVSAVDPVANYLVRVVVWSLAKAKGVGPVFHTGQNTSQSPWSISWLIMAGINSSIGGQAAGMTNGSDFSRYARSKSGYVIGTFLCLFLTGTLVSLIGLTTTAACQKIFGTVFWNQPDLFMAIVDGGKGSSGSRVAVFSLSLGFGLSVCGYSIRCGSTD